jgi:hypothetical protein
LAFEEPSNSAKLNQHREECGFCISGVARLLLIHSTAGRDDMLKFFQTCIPFATKVMGSAVEKYGFEPSQTGEGLRTLLSPLRKIVDCGVFLTGCMQFQSNLSKFESDPEIAALSQVLKQKFVPC